MLFSTAVSYSFSRRSNTHQLVFNQLGWDSGLGLYDYNARYYDPHSGRFISADTLVPDPASPQAFNRYAYVLGNPLRYSDPTGHFTEEAIMNYLTGAYRDDAQYMYELWKSDAEWWDMLRAAQDGDVLVGSIFYYGDHGMFYTLQGEGQDVLGGVFWSDPYGNKLSGYQPRGNHEGHQLGDFFDPGGFGGLTWDGFIRWDGGTPSFYVRNSSYFSQGTTPSYVRTGLSVAWNAVAFFVGLAIPGTKVEKIIGLTGVFATPSIDSAWLSFNGMQQGDVRVFLGDHRLIFNGANGGYRLRTASWAFDRDGRMALRVTYWSE